MPIETAWLDSKGAVPGLDQLGIRANAIRMYAHLVPGITNVTDRARYFAIHPWIVHRWAATTATDDLTAFRSLVKRVECMLALGERVRVHGSAEESYGVVGTIRLSRWLRDKPDPRRHAYNVPLEQLQTEYFKNKWGSLGQYYGGAETDLGILNWEESVPKLTPLGQKLAVAFDTVARKCRFSELLDSKKISISQIRRLGENAGFSMMSRSEVAILREIFLDSNDLYGASGLRRRQTCLLLLSLAAQRKRPLNDPAQTVLAAALHGRCDDNLPYLCPAPLAEHLPLWQTYAYQEFLAFALEMMLAASVEVLHNLEVKHTARPATVSELAENTAQVISKNMQCEKVSNLLADAVSKLTYPAVNPKADPWEEEALRATANKALKRGNISGALESALKLTLRICARIGLSRSPYSRFTSTGLQIDNQRFGLMSIQQVFESHAHSNVHEALVEIVTTIVNLHLRVATAKLAYNHDFTYKLVYDNGRLRKVRGVEPALSSPRLKQAAQVLADLELLLRKDRAFSVTPDGLHMLQLFGC